MTSSRRSCLCERRCLVFNCPFGEYYPLSLNKSCLSLASVRRSTTDHRHLYGLDTCHHTTDTCTVLTRSSNLTTSTSSISASSSGPRWMLSSLYGRRGWCHRRKQNGTRWSVTRTKHNVGETAVRVRMSDHYLTTLQYRWRRHSLREHNYGWGELMIGKLSGFFAFLIFIGTSALLKQGRKLRGGQGGTVPPKIWGGGDGGAYIPPNISTRIAISV